MGQIYGNDLGRVMNENMTQDVISLFRSRVLRKQKGTLGERKKKDMKYDMLQQKKGTFKEMINLNDYSMYYSRQCWP